MPFDQADREAISLQIVTITAQINGINAAKAQFQAQINTVQALDTANKDLLNPVNSLTTEYQLEIGYLDGNLRTNFVEQDMVDAANRILMNDFFPNDTAVSVPSLSASSNIWTKFNPFAGNFAIGKNYSESYAIITNEITLINTILGYITAAGTHPDIQNTTGEECSTGGICSLPQYLDMSDCTGGSGVWTPGSDTIIPNPVIQTLKTNIVAAANSLVSLLGTEVASIVTNDPNITNQTNNNAAISNINTVFLPALSGWLAYPDFNPLTGVSCVVFNSYNPALLAPTKLYSVDLAALQTALNNRLTFITTRQSQLNTLFGSITQDLTTGLITASSGLYGLRYSYLNLRLNLLSGSLTKLIGLQNSYAAQVTLVANLMASEAIYEALLPTTLFKSAGTGTTTLHLVDTSFLSPGDHVYVYAEGQQELVRAIASINNTVVVLNDIVPQKYDPNVNNARLYKDLT